MLVILCTPIHTLATNGDIELNLQEQIDLLYLLDQFYNNAWNKLLIVITILISLVAGVLPLSIEYFRRQKLQAAMNDLKDAKEQNKELKKYYEEQIKLVKESYSKSENMNNELRKEIKESIEEVKEKNNENEKINSELGNKMESLMDNVEELKINYSKAKQDLLLEYYIRMVDSLLEAYNNTSDDATKEAFQSEIIKFENLIDKIRAANKRPDYELQIKINNEVIGGNTVREFYKNVMEYLIEQEVKLEDIVPYKTGKIRYLISDKAVHQNGADFNAPLEIGPYFLETHKSKKTAKQDIIQFLEKLGTVKVEEVI